MQITNRLDMIKWINFLHIYQPPYQEKELIHRISQESYWPLANILAKDKKFKITLNFSGCLLEHLYNIGEEKLIEEFKKLVENGQIELVGSARYHPILPLLPSKEIERQIRLNEQILKRAFDYKEKPAGFFLPEMAYSKKVAKIIKKMGYQWIILDEIAYKGKLGQIDYDKKYKIKDIGLTVIFRNRNISNTYVPKTITELLKKSNPPTYLISATDGEVYGHHHIDGSNEFEKTLQNPLVQTLTVSEYLKSLPPKTELVTPINSSWETTLSELKRKIPFALWQNPDNKIHQYLWDLRKIAIRLISKSKEHGLNYDWARHHLDRGLSSCSWWWASDKKIGAFNFLTWDPDTIEKGLRELISSIRSLKNISKATKLKAERYYHLLIKEIWKKHWEKYHRLENKKEKLPLEIKKGLSLLDQNYLIETFEKKLPLDLIYDTKIDYIKIRTIKQNIGKKTFYHIVCQYTIYFKNQATKPLTVFCNANSKEERLGAFEALNFLWENGFAKGSLTCPRPLFYQQRLKAMFYKGPTGNNLYQKIIEPKAKQQDFEKGINLTAKWLAKLHCLPTEKAKNFNPIQSKIATALPGPEKFLSIIKDRHQKYPYYHREVKETFEKITELEKKMLINEKKSIIHGDIHPENVIYNSEKQKVTIIDYTDCCLAHYTRDLGNFYQQLGSMLDSKLNSEAIEKLKKNFIESYLKERKIEFSQKEINLFLLYQAWTSLRSAIFFLTIVMFQRPQAKKLIEEAKGYLKLIKT